MSEKLKVLSRLPERSRLNGSTRKRVWEGLENTNYDVIVIGAGITGVGTALDAANRGLKTLLVDRSDLASGTSRWSSKLAHGGLRYLASGQFMVAHESAVERGNLLAYIAPHLARPVPFLIPLDDQTGTIMGLAGEAGARLGDALRIVAGTSGELLPSPHRISALDAMTYAPCLDLDQLRGAVLYWDGQLTDDARLVTAVARTAAAAGADVLTYAPASEVTESSVVLTDRFTGVAKRVNAQVVINAAGVWVDQIEPKISITPSRGSHIVVDAAKLGNPRAVWTAPVPGHFGRYALAMPQEDGLVYIGLTDEEAPGVDGENPPVPEEDIDFLLDCINPGLGVKLTREDVLGQFAGLRPLVTSEASSTADISRRHLLLDEPGHPITIAGGKLTAYRQMAQDAVDAACKRIGSTVRCRTEHLPLVGAASPRTLRDVAAPSRLVHRYGTEAPLITEMCGEMPELSTPVAPGSGLTLAEFVYAIAAEGAVTVEDVLARRTRLTMVASRAEAARPWAERAFQILGVEPLEPAALPAPAEPEPF